MNSLALAFNNTKNVFLDENGNPLTGTAFLSDNETIIRCKSGFLDGDVFDKNGNLVNVIPAIEGKGHIEYWRMNKLHRDGNLPAVISNNFTERQFWHNGEYLEHIEE